MGSIKELIETQAYLCANEDCKGPIDIEDAHVATKYICLVGDPEGRSTGQLVLVCDFCAAGIKVGGGFDRCGDTLTLRKHVSKPEADKLLSHYPTVQRIESPSGVYERTEDHDD